jgi:DNA polymerase-4
MAEKIRQRIKDELGLCASVGIASSKVVAKIASDLAKPDGLLEVPVGEEGAFLAPLPVDKLPGVGKKSQQILKDLGVNTIGQLAKLPPERLKSHFGAWGEVLHRYARGIDERKVEPPTSAKSTSRETTFPRDIKDPSFLRAALRYLSERVGSDLRQKGKLARCIRLKMRYADFTTITRQRTLEQPTDLDQVIFDTALKLMKRELAGGKQAIRLLGVGASSLVASGRQLDMLDASAQRLAKLNQAIDRIRRKYGFSAIQTGGTLRLKDIFPQSADGDAIHTPGR